MENREDLRSILPYLPLLIRSSTLFWPPLVVEALKALEKGPDYSGVDSGELLVLAISDLRNSLCLSDEPLAPSALQGYELFFDELISREESRKFFGEVIPALASLLLKFPSLLDLHYQNADGLISVGGNYVKTGLRILETQEAGIVFLGQDIISAILGCSFFCLFPVSNRGSNLPMINFDQLFASLYDDYNEKQESKIRCIIHYFERICCHTPTGFVSFERKVLPLKGSPFHISYPHADFWSHSVIPLCSFEVQNSGLIEDQSSGSMEVDFANKYIGGGSLHRGCVQEEIRFMITPELIAGMLFLPSMADNEAIEIVGAERFSSYTGYASTFRFSGDYIDKSEVDSFGRHRSRIIAIDALCNPRMRQYEVEFLLREINKAFCGFLDQYKLWQYKRLLCKRGCFSPGLDADTSTSMEGDEGETSSQMTRNFQACQSMDQEENIGIATGNWGCGAFGGDPELKSIIQWLAASQALRPFILYYTFGMEALQNLEKVVHWILLHKWTVGDLWNMLVEYSMKRVIGETKAGFFTWLVPSICGHGS